jgi:hypothetical protein
MWVQSLRPSACGLNTRNEPLSAVLCVESSDGRTVRRTGPSSDRLAGAQLVRTVPCCICMSVLSSTTRLRKEIINIA